MDKSFACIKDNIVVNVLMFDDERPEIMDEWKEKNGYDFYVPSTLKAYIGSKYEGGCFWLPSPFPSWIKDYGTNEWVAPVPYPTFDKDNPVFYDWDEASLSWVEVP